MYLRPDDSLSVTVKNTVSPHNTGEECPLPGNSMDHLMLFFCIVSGIPFSGECPEVPGPRN